MTDFSGVNGEAYENAESYMAAIDINLQGREGQGFENADECAAFAKENNLDMMAYSPSTKGFYHVSHVGEPLTSLSYKQQYGNILFYRVTEGDRIKRKEYVPSGYSAMNKALMLTESGNGIRGPLYVRDYFVPTGYRNPSTGLWNVAQPIPYFAKETGADTSFIYHLLEHISGDNYPYLLSWLRQKLLYPRKKTEVVPVFIGNQGTGKSSFGEFVCTALFGKENVIVTHTFNGSARFNSDQTDRLVVSIEEKSKDDKYNATNILKSLATARKVRKELKGLDPYYQESYTEYILTTNDKVPIKFDNLDQRRFMVMQADPDFARKKFEERETATSLLADEVFTKLTGMNRNQEVVGDPLFEQKETVQQFIHELVNKKDLPSPRDFVITDAFKGMHNIPRTNEARAIEQFILSLAPFIYISLMREKIVTDVVDQDGHKDSLDQVTPYEDGLLFVGAYGDKYPSRVALNQSLLFRDRDTNKEWSLATVAKVMNDTASTLEREFGIRLLTTTDVPRNGGFKNCDIRYRRSEAFWFALSSGVSPKVYLTPLDPDRDITKIAAIKARLEVVRQRYNEDYQVDDNGPLEVLNPLREGMDRKADNVKTMDTFLLEADEATSILMSREKVLIEAGETDAEVVFKERLAVQREEGIRLMNQGVVNRLVYSGHKSIHMLVTMKEGPSTKEERRWLDAYLKNTLSQRLVFDMMTSDAARLTRAPVEFDRHKDGLIGKQHLIREKQCVYNLKWKPLYQQWLVTKRTFIETQAKNKFLPMKKAYKESCEALLQGTFWTDDRWNGLRNKLFFVSYRLCRSMGFSEQTMWDGIEEDLKGYYKPKGIKYWKDRRDCDLIRSINAEFDEEGYNWE